MTEKKKQHLFSLTRNDFEWEYRRGSGKGGQKRNKTSNAVRVTHRPSGAVGNAEDGRSQLQNRKLAFKRLSETKEFKNWIKIEAARKAGMLHDIEEAVEKAMHPKNLRIEAKEDGKWQPLK